jgi:adiponectin receptor
MQWVSHFAYIGEKLILIHVIQKMRFPERWWPGKFDMCSSHSFMHMLVVCAAVIQMIGYLEAFDYTYSHITCSWVTTFYRASSHRDERQPSNLVSAIGDSGSKVLLGARSVDIHNEGENIYSREQGSSAMIGNAWNWGRSSVSVVRFVVLTLWGSFRPPSLPSF